MSYINVAQADQYLAHNAGWLALTEVVKRNHLVTAALWLNYTYEWPGVLAACPVSENFGAIGFPYTYPFIMNDQQAIEASKSAWPRVDECGGMLMDADGCPLSDVPHQVKFSQAAAAEESYRIPLFASPTVDAGGLTKKRIKAGPVEIERVWAEPTRGGSGELVISRIDAMLHGIAQRRGKNAKTGRMPLLF